MPIINLLLPDQSEEFRALEHALASASDFAVACQLLAGTAAEILAVPALLLEQQGRDRWRIVGESGAIPSAEIMSRGASRALAILTEASQRVTDVSLDDGGWTILSLRPAGEPALLLMVSGDWTLSRSLLQSLAVSIGNALKRLERPQRTGLDRRVAAAFRLPRRLARATDAAHSYQIIIDACARTVDAEKGSIAIYDREAGALSIAATFGYPALLVRHVRVHPGDGVIGAVFRTGRALQVDDIQRVTGAPQPRLRYRTRSFIAIPLSVRNNVLGVISLSDPQGGRFTHADLRNVRALAHVASMALDRMDALEDARAHARVAAVDPLTTLFNRRSFISRLHEEVERARRQSSSLAVLMLDVDDFKQLNDRLGHGVGDAVLRVTGDVLHRSVRSFDVCARYGGDEFAILMPGTGPESAQQIAERIREGVEGSRPPGGPWADDLRLTTSIGCATFGGGTADDLIERADQALYVAKREGKNRVRLAPSPSQSTPD